jgi:fido (protein-threonine AMPylation protein)
MQDASDQGAFSFLSGLTSDKLRQRIQGWEYLTTTNLFKKRRSAAAWTGAFLLGIHRDVFSKLFPCEAGRYRTGEANFGDQAGARPEHLDSLLQNLVAGIQAHLEEALGEHDIENRIDLAFTHAATDHAEMIRIHPFVDGNGRWARIATNAFLYDCGFRIGTIIRKSDKRDYIAALTRCIQFNAPGDLANLFVAGYVRELKKRLGPT